MKFPYEVWLQALIQIFKQASVQFLFFFGTLFILGFVLTLLSRWTQNAFEQFKFPKLGLYLFGIIGVPAHELCHAIFAKLFFHQVNHVKWFDPKGKNGAYGSVEHSYDSQSFFHRLGLFFIGMGPVLLVPVFLYFMYQGLVPKASHLELSFLNPLNFIKNFAASVLHQQNWRSVGFYVFIYLTICLTSQMELSSEDFKIARGGIFPFFVLFCITNAASVIFKWNLHAKFLYFFKTSFAVWGGFFLFAVLIAFVNLILCSVFLNILNRLMGEPAINPFRG